MKARPFSFVEKDTIGGQCQKALLKSVLHPENMPKRAGVPDPVEVRDEDELVDLLKMAFLRAASRGCYGVQLLFDDEYEDGTFHGTLPAFIVFEDEPLASDIDEEGGPVLAVECSWLPDYEEVEHVFEVLTKQNLRCNYTGQFMDGAGSEAYYVSWAWEAEEEAGGRLWLMKGSAAKAYEDGVPLEDLLAN